MATNVGDGDGPGGDLPAHLLPMRARLRASDSSIPAADGCTADGTDARPNERTGRRIAHGVSHNGPGACAQEPAGQRPLVGMIGDWHPATPVPLPQQDQQTGRTIHFKRLPDSPPDGLQTGGLSADKGCRSRKDGEDR